MDSILRYFDEWTRDEDSFLEENYEFMGAAGVAEALCRTKSSVYGRVEALRRLGRGPERVKPHQPRWSETEELFLINNWPTMSTNQLMQHLPRRSKGAIKVRAAFLGLLKGRNVFEDMEAA